MKNKTTLEKVIFNDHKTLDQIKEIYEEAFPIEERRDFKNICSLIERNPNFNCLGIFHEERLVGLLTYWVLPGSTPFAYGEHLAISSSMRGLSIGSIVLEKFAEMAQLPIILEVEHPTSEQAVKRIRFYERNGYKLWELDYIQPPYGENLPPVPLYLMTIGEIALDDNYEEVKKTLYREVYGLTEEM
ncbi:MAG: GNAT family N-acetyltransferase [Bacteroidales bacterium]